MVSTNSMWYQTCTHSGKWQQSDFVLHVMISNTFKKSRRCLQCSSKFNCIGKSINLFKVSVVSIMYVLHYFTWTKIKMHHKVSTMLSWNSPNMFGHPSHVPTALASQYPPVYRNVPVSPSLRNHLGSQPFSCIFLDCIQSKSIQINVQEILQKRKKSIATISVKINKTSLIMKQRWDGKKSIKVINKTNIIKVTYHSLPLFQPLFLHISFLVFPIL